MHHYWLQCVASGWIVRTSYHIEIRTMRETCINMCKQTIWSPYPQKWLSVLALVAGVVKGWRLCCRTVQSALLASQQYYHHYDGSCHGGEDYEDSHQ